MSSLHSIAVSILSVDNPFEASETDAEQFGFVALCAGAIVAVNIILVAFALAARRRGPKVAPVVYEWVPAATTPAVDPNVPVERVNPLHAKRAEREAERLAAEAASKRAAPLRPAARRVAPPRKH